MEWITRRTFAICSRIMYYVRIFLSHVNWINETPNFYSNRPLPTENRPTKIGYRNPTLAVVPLTALFAVVRVRAHPYHSVNVRILESRMYCTRTQNCIKAMKHPPNIISSLFCSQLCKNQKIEKWYSHWFPLPSSLLLFPSFQKTVLKFVDNIGIFVRSFSASVWTPSYSGRMRQDDDTMMILVIIAITGCQLTVSRPVMESSKPKKIVWRMMGQKMKRFQLWATTLPTTRRSLVIKWREIVFNLKNCVLFDFIICIYFASTEKKKELFVHSVVGALSSHHERQQFLIDAIIAGGQIAFAATNIWSKISYASINGNFMVAGVIEYVRRYMKITLNNVEKCCHQQLDWISRDWILRKLPLA